MFHNFSGQTADEVWLSAAGAFGPSGDAARSVASSTQPSRAGSTREILHATISIADPRQRWVASRTPPLNPAFAIAELVWILSGRNDSRLLNYFNRELPSFAGKSETYHGAYGYRLRQHLGLDQLDRAFHALAREPDSRQVVLQIWDARCDLPLEDGLPVAADVPCNVLSMLKVRSGVLEWNQVLRSNDLFRGVPYNFVQFTTLQEIVAGWLGVAVGSYNHLADSLHVYEPDMKGLAAAVPLGLSPNTDSLALSRPEFDLVLAELVARAEEVVSDGTSAEQLLAATRRTQLPPAYRNLLALLCAEGARRRKCSDAARSIMDCCDNPCLSAMFRRWCERWSGTITAAYPT